MTTLFIEASLIGLTARPLGDWKRGPLIRLAEGAASDDLRTEGAAIYSRRAVAALGWLQAADEKVHIFGSAADRAVLDWLAGRGFSVIEATVPRLVESTPLALTRPWLATVASRGRAPHNIRARFTTAAQLGMTEAHVDHALRMCEGSAW